MNHEIYLESKNLSLLFQHLIMRRGQQILSVHVHAKILKIK